MDWQIGRPYSFRNFNCWHYAREMRAQVGLETQLFTVKNLRSAYQLIKDRTDAEDFGLKKVTEPQNYDIVIIRGKIKGKPSFHCGVWFEGFVMHCSLQLGGVWRQPFTEFINGVEGYTFWR